MSRISTGASLALNSAVIWLLIATTAMVAQTGNWHEQILQPAMSGNWLADHGENCIGYTRTNSQYIYFFDTRTSQWSEVDLGSPQTFFDIEAAGQTVLACSEEMIIGYSAANSQWDTLHYQGVLLNPSGPGILRGYGCGERLAHFITDTHFYVFDSELGLWQAYSYMYPGDPGVGSGYFWSGDEYAGAIINQNLPNFNLNLVYSLPQHAFNENPQGGAYYHTDWGMTHGFVTTWSDAVDTYYLTGYCAQTNEFSMKTLLPPFGSYEGGSCLFPSRLVEKTVAVFHYLEFLSEARVLAYDTRQGHWYEASYYYDPDHYTRLGWWYYGGTVAAVGQYNTNTLENTYLLFDGTSGTFNTITPGIYYTGSISGHPNTGGNLIAAFDTTTIWYYNAANQNSYWANMEGPISNGPFIGDNYAIMGSYRVSGEPLNMRVFNSDTDQLTYISVGGGPVSFIGSPYICAFTAGTANNEVYFYSGYVDGYREIEYPVNAYPGLNVWEHLALSSTGSESHLYDAGSNAVYELAYYPPTSLVGKDIAIFHKSENTIEAYSSEHQQLSEFAIPGGVLGMQVGDHVGLISAYGLNNYYAYNGFYHNLVELQPTGMWQSSLVGGATALVIRLDRIYAFDPQAPTGIEQDEQSPAGFNLAQNYPNPFNPATTINYQLSTAGEVSLIIYDVLGRSVNKLLAGIKHRAGAYSLAWDGRDTAGRPVASGVYIYRLTIKDQKARRYVKSRKMVLMK